MDYCEVCLHEWIVFQYLFFFYKNTKLFQKFILNQSIKGKCSFFFIHWKVQILSDILCTRIKNWINLESIKVYVLEKVKAFNYKFSRFLKMPLFALITILTVQHYLMLRSKEKLYNCLWIYKHSKQKNGGIVKKKIVQRKIKSCKNYFCL